MKKLIVLGKTILKKILKLMLGAEKMFLIDRGQETNHLQILLLMNEMGIFTSYSSPRQTCFQFSRLFRRIHGSPI